MTTTQEITMPRTSTHPVAVVVFVNAEGADAHDAINVAEMAVGGHLRASDPNGQLFIQTRVGQRAVRVSQVIELGRASHNGLIGLTTSAAAYKP